MKTLVGLVSVVVLLAGCSSATLPESAPEPEVLEEAKAAPEPEVIEEIEPAQEPEVVEEEAEPEPEPEPEVSEAEVEACRVAWEAELKAVEQGALDDATLRATGTECPNLEVWRQIRDEVGYGSKSPSLVTAICALKDDARICD